MIKKLIRKMQTAAGGPIRLRFTPEQIAYFESQGLPLGMNNSGGLRLRAEGAQAQLYQELENKRKVEKIKSRMEMRPTLKRKATFSEKLRDKQDEYVQTPQVVGMSGADPLLSFYVGGVGLNGIGALAKTGLWNVAKYAPTTQLGNWGRSYFVGNAFKNSFNGNVPTLTSQTTSLLYLPVKLNETGLTSLKFFERPSKISEAESLGFGRSRGFNPESGSDLHEFYTLLDRRQTILDALRKLKAPENMGVDETISKNSGSIIEDGYLMSNGYRYTPVSEKHFSTGTNMSFGRQGIGGGGHNYGLNLGGQSTRVKDLGKESKITYSTPKTNLNRDDHTNLDIVITAENDKANKEGIKLLTKGMRDMESGAEFSGDASSTTAAEALSSWLRLAKNKPQLRETAMSNAKIALDNNAGISLGKHTVTDPLHGIVTENATMSPDAYSYLYRTAANNSDKFHLGYTMKAGNFNSFARNPKNAYMYDVEQNYLDGLITPQEYVELFNSWSLPLGGRRAYFYNGRVYKPQPFLIRNKQGGKMNTLDFLKNGSGIHIKPENKGKFTKYCHGKVTSECIARGKRSSNPAIRKRATFADNARHFKHRSGGSFKGYPSKAAYDVRLEEVAGFKKGGKAFVNRVSILDSNPDAYKYVKKKYKMRSALQGTKLNLFLSSDLGLFAISTVGQLYDGIKSQSNYNKFLKLNNKRIKSGKEAIINNIGDTSQEAILLLNQLKLLNPDINYSSIDLWLILQQIANQRRLNNMLKANQWELNLLQLLNLWINAIQNNSGIGDILSGIGDILSSKGLGGDSSNNNSIKNSYFDNYVKNYFSKSKI